MNDRGLNYAPGIDHATLPLRNLRDALRDRQRALATYGHALYAPDFRVSTEEREQHCKELRARIDTAQAVIDGHMVALLNAIEETL